MYIKIISIYFSIIHITLKYLLKVLRREKVIVIDGINGKAFK